MEIKCPTCKKKYEIPDNYMTPNGITINCPKCDSSFTSLPGGIVLTPTPSAGKKTSHGSSQQTNPFLSQSAQPDIPYSNEQSVYSPYPKTTVKSAPELQNGDELAGNYIVKNKIGTGGFANVYCVEHKTLKEDIAIKAIPTFGNIEAVLESFVHEYRAQNRIKDQKHILRSETPVKVEHAGMDWVLLPMELADKTFREWLQETENNLSGRLNDGVDMFKQACRGVQAIHDAGLLHLDIKPENFLLIKDTKDGQYIVKLSDFGLTRGLGKLAESRPELLRDEIGTPAYMAPEQIRSAHWKDIDNAADIYALGTILYELVEGNLPYSGTVDQIKQKKMDDLKPKKVSGEKENWWRIIGRCIARTPEQRYQSVEELLRDLERMLLGTTISLDVSCPSCGHITLNPNVRFCESCHANLDSLFEPCSKCARNVRIDIDSCPGCGHGIGAERLFKVRSEKLETLKDEDPVEAIELLEEMIKAGYGIDDKQYALIKSLREKQNKVSALIEKATSPALKNEPDKSLELWRNVLKLVPRHRVAIKNIQELEKIVKQIRGLLDKIKQYVDRASFNEAKNILNDALEKLPPKDAIRTLIQRIHDQETIYKKAFREADALFREEKYKEATERIDEAVQICPESKEAVELKEKADSLLSEVDSLQKSARHYIDSAEFEKANNAIGKINELWRSYDVSSLKQKLNTVKPEYTKKFESAQENYSKKYLEKAEIDCSSAIQQCPISENAKGLSKKISNNKSDAWKHSKNAESAMHRAEFDAADKEIQRSRSLWSNNDKINGFVNIISSTRSKYEHKIDEANAYLQKKRFDHARSAARDALTICRESQEAESLIMSIDSEEERWDRVKKERTGMALFLLKWSLLVIPGIIGLYILFTTDYSFRVGLFSFIGLDFVVPDIIGKLLILALTASAPIFHLAHISRMYVKISYWSFIDGKTEVFVFIFSITFFFIGILVVGVSPLLGLIVAALWSFISSKSV